MKLETFKTCRPSMSVTSCAPKSEFRFFSGVFIVSARLRRTTKGLKLAGRHWESPYQSAYRGPITSSPGGKGACGCGKMIQVVGILISYECDFLSSFICMLAHSFPNRENRRSPSYPREKCSYIGRHVKPRFEAAITMQD